MKNIGSIKWKLVFMYLGLVLIVMIVSGTYILFTLTNIEENKVEVQLESYAKRISEQVIQSVDEENFQKELLRFSQTGSDSSFLQGNILDKDGNTIASTTVSQPPYPDYKGSEIISAIMGNAAYGEERSDTDSFGLVKMWMSFATPVKNNDNEIMYIVYTQIDTSEIRASLGQTRQSIIAAAILALMLTAFMGYIFARTLTVPIQELTNKAKELAEGNLNQRVVVKSNDEISQLAKSFNYMAGELNKNIDIISNEKNKLETIIHNMTDGVISFDRTGEVIHFNSVALDMLEMDNMEVNIAGFIKRFDINTGVYLDMSPNNSKSSVFPVGDKFINATFSPYYGKDKLDGVVIVLQDITEQKKLDDMRKEFVANVSHELRTPLTTVKSYTETLIDGAIDDKEIAMEFLGIIDSEADRMSFLVRDLLQLSRFDNKQTVLNITEVDINLFMEDTVKQNKIHADNKNQNLYFIPYKNNVFIKADRDRLGQVVNNIITNAIKYSLNGAEVKCWIEEDTTYYKIIVQDTGMGITKKDQARIFERFYRVDKARSRAMGGTGLGLAIAKEIMEVHGGKITVESEYGRGTKMTLWFLKRIESPIKV